jgi:hypothetical protein
MFLKNEKSRCLGSMMIMNPDDEIANSDICSGELTFDIPYPLEPINSYHYPDLYFHSSGSLIAYPIEVFHRPSKKNIEKSIKKLKRKSKELEVIPFVKCWSGNYSFGIRLSTKNPTREEIEKIYEAFNHLKSIDWSGGFEIYQ